MTIIEEDIVSLLEKFSTLSLSTTPQISANDLNLDCVEVEHLSLAKVFDKLKQLLDDSEKEPMTDGTRPIILQLPSRSDVYQIYIKALGRIVLKKHVITRTSASRKTANITVVTTRAMHLIMNAINDGEIMTKRDLFYSDPVIFHNQDASDKAIDDIACMVGCTRVSLNIVAAERGIVIGNLTFIYHKKKIDCMSIEAGTQIPPRVHELESIRSEALFILVVEKHATFNRLIQNKFHTRFRCIIVTSMGYPDVSTRLLVRRMQMDLKLPVFALMDADPFGISILSVYRYGSKNMSYDNRNLVIPGIKLIGVRPKDWETYELPEACLLPLTPTDITIANNLLDEEFVKENPEWVEDLNYMLENQKKCETQAFNSHGLGYLCNVYLPTKLQEILEAHL